MLDWGVHLIDQLLWMIKAPLKSVLQNAQSAEA